jgi:outer membrane lipoprotein carrier protein
MKVAMKMAVLAATWWVGGAAAGGIESLKAFVAEVRAARTEFVQTVTDNTGRKVQESSGSFVFARPGRFRWTYVKPFDQVIVGDGVKVWVYDKDLEQVTVKALGDALGSSPAALLAGNNDVDRAYTFSALPRKDGLEWMEAVPKDEESSFEKMRLGFRKNNPERLELQDRLGQVTTIRFTKLVRNPKLAADVFSFTPPPGADVVGDK